MSNVESSSESTSTASEADSTQIGLQINEAVNKMEENVKKLQTADQCEKAQILYDLGEFDQSAAQLQTIQESQQTDQIKLLLKKLQIAQMQKTGQQDWKLILQTSLQQLFLNEVQNYFSSKIEVFNHETMGRGIRAKEDIEIGEIIMVERAFLIGTEKQMFKQLQLKQQFISNKVLQEYQNLVGGFDFDFKTLYEKSCKNSFYIGQQLQDHDFNQYDDDHTGLFLAASQFNHSCLYNVETVFINDICVKIVVRPAKKGDQLFNIYGSLGFPSIASVKEQFAEQFGFQCGCQVCAQIKPQFAEHIDNFIRTIENCYKVFENLRNVFSLENDIVDSGMLQKYLHFARVTTIHFENYCKDNNLNLQMLFCQTYRDLAQHFRDFLQEEDSNKAETFFLLLRTCKYLGINGQKAFSGELEFECEQKFTSYIDVQDLLEVAVYAKQLSKEFKPVFECAKQLHNRLIGQIIEFEELYYEEIDLLKL